MWKRDGFIVHEKTMAQVQLLSDEQAGQLLKAMIKYYNGKDDGNVDNIIKIIMIDAVERMDADKENYERLSAIRSEAGRQGAIKRWQTNGKAIANDSKAMANDADSDSDSDSVSVLKDKKKVRFTPPTVEEVKAYCLERHNNVDAEAFIAFYDSKGWKVGNAPMKNWKAAIITWEKRQKEKPVIRANKFQNFPARNDPEHNDLVQKIIAMNAGG